MSISAILAFVFLLPGYISYLVVQQYTVGFGRKSGNFDKTLISLLFDIPIFLITIKIFNSMYFIKLLNLEKYNFDGFSTFDQFTILVDNNINLIILLFIVSIVISIIIGFVWACMLRAPSFIRQITNKVLGFISGNKKSVNVITPYHSIWKQEFVKPADPIPAEVFDLANGNAIAEGFLEEVSLDLENNLEFKLCDRNTFQYLKDNNYFDEVEFTYINRTKNLKIIVYNQDKYLSLLEHEEGEETNEQ